MSLFLARHGTALPQNIDPEQGLSDEGAAEVERIAHIVKEQGIRVSSIKHSGKKRALQTAHIFAYILNPEGGVMETSGINPLDDVYAFADTIDSSENSMFVGHLPFMERLTSYLITGSTDKPVFRFQNSGIACLEKDAGVDCWFIKWAFIPGMGSQKVLKK